WGWDPEATVPHSVSKATALTADVPTSRPMITCLAVTERWILRSRRSPPPLAPRTAHRRPPGRRAPRAHVGPPPTPARRPARRVGPRSRRPPRPHALEGGRSTRRARWPTHPASDPPPVPRERWAGRGPATSASRPRRSVPTGAASGRWRTGGPTPRCTPSPLLVLGRGDAPIPTTTGLPTPDTLRRTSRRPRSRGHGWTPGRPAASGRR